MGKRKAHAAETAFTADDILFQNAICDYHRSVTDGKGSCDRIVNSDDRELLPLLYPSIVLGTGRDKVPKVYLILLADVIQKKELGPFKAPSGRLIDCRDLINLTYCGHVAQRRALQRDFRNPWQGYLAKSSAWTDYKKAGIHLRLSCMMYDAVMRSDYGILYSRPDPPVYSTQTPSLVTAQTQQDAIPYDATIDDPTSTELTPERDHAASDFDPYDSIDNAADAQELNWDDFFVPTEDEDQGSTPIDDRPPHPGITDRASHPSPPSAQATHPSEASGSGFQNTSPQIASAWPAIDYTHIRSPGEASGSEYAVSANSGKSTPSSSGKRPRGDWERDDDDIDDLEARMGRLGLNNMIKQLDLIPSETSLRGFINEMLSHLRTFLDEAKEWRLGPAKDVTSRLFPLEDPKGAQRNAWDDLMSSFEIPDMDVDRPGIATFTRAPYVEAMSNFATQTFRPQGIAECHRQILDDEWLQQAMLSPDQRTWKNQALFESRLIGRDLNDHRSWRYRSTSRREFTNRSAMLQASLILESTRQLWISCFLRLYGYGEAMSRDQVAAIRADLNELKGLVECYVEVPQTDIAGIVRRMDILEKCYGRLSAALPSSNSALVCIALDSTVGEIGSLARNLATLCSEHNFEKIHSSLKTNIEYNFAPATRLQRDCQSFLRQLARLTTENHYDVGKWLFSREVDLPSYAAWHKTLRSEGLSEQEEYVETILNAIRKPES